MMIRSTSKSIAATLEELVEHLETHQRAEVPARRGNGRLCVSAPLVVGTKLRNMATDDERTGNVTATKSDGRFQPLHHGWMIDLSLDGIGFLLEHELASGLTVWADLTALSDYPLMLPIRVIYCQQIMPNTWRIGACFDGDE